MSGGDRWDVHKIRDDFPILSRKVHGKPLVYLDSGATTQKPRAVLRALEDYYSGFNANVHRGAHLLSQEATEAYEGVRSKVTTFLGGGKAREVIFTRGTTDAINLVAATWGRANVGAGDDVVVTRMEHHANFVPWQVLAREKGANFKIVELGSDFRLDLKSLQEKLSVRPKIFAFAMMSNVLGTVNPVAEIAAMAKRAGAIVVLDAAQGLAHFPLRLSELKDVDFVAFSAHKICGPTGVGVLWGREELLEKMPPCTYGGDMILLVEDQKTVWNEIPWKFEAGTPPIAGVIGMGAALDYLNTLGLERIGRYEEELSLYTLERLGSLDGVLLKGPREVEGRGPVFSFMVEGVHPHDLSTFMDLQGIAIRAGHHCAQPLAAALGAPATSRASLSFYNTRDEIDRLADAIGDARKYFGVAK